VLRWALVLLLVAGIAALLGFSNVAGAALEIARVLFFLFVLAFLVIVVLGARKR
jgi:uncharacterized membrane protein YtjA (UPF0391 family)